MADTKRLESIAVGAIVSRLQKAGLLVARPEFDVDGTDLIVLKTVRDGAQFCRLQAKYRSARSRKRKAVLIPSRHVSEAFMVFLYVDYNATEDGLYCFFEPDIRAWPLDPESQYRLSLDGDILNSLSRFLFGDNTLTSIEHILDTSNAEKEYRHLVLAPYEYQAYPAQSAGADTMTLVPSPIGHIPILRNGTTGIETLGPPAPGDPSRFEYNPTTGTWSAKVESS